MKYIAALIITLSVMSCSKKTAAVLPDPLQAGWEGQKVCKVLEDNDKLRVLKCSFAPGIGHEWHEHAPHFGYTLEAGSFQIEQGDSTRTANVPQGYYWYKDASSQHQVLNVGETTSTYLIIEPKD